MSQVPGAQDLSVITAGRDVVLVRPLAALRSTPDRAPERSFGTTVRLMLLVLLVLATGLHITQLLYLTPRWACVWLALLVGLTGALYLLHPWWTVRRNRLRRLSVDTGIARYLHRLWADTGATGAEPAWMLRPAGTATGARALGLPGRRMVQLDPGLVDQFGLEDRPGCPGENRARFTATVRQAIAQLENRGVDRTHLARAVFQAHVVVTLLPFLGIVVHQNLLYRPLTRGPRTVAGLGWIPVLVLCMVLARLVLLAVFRIRELEADVIAGRDPGTRGRLIAVTAESADRQVDRPRPWQGRRRARHPGGGGRDDALSWWEWIQRLPWLRHQPTERRRLACLVDPRRILVPRTGDLVAVGGAAAMLVGAVGPVVDDVLPGNRGLPGPVTGAIAATLVTVPVVAVLRRASAVASTRTRWRLPLAVGTGSLLGAPLTWVVMVTDPVMAGWGSPSAVALTVLPLVVGTALVTGWTAGAERRPGGTAR